MKQLNEDPALSKCFIDTFEGTIDKNKDMSDFENFTY